MSAASKDYLAGVSCPVCGAGQVRVMDTRVIASSPNSVRRRRVCADCAHRFTTLEVVVPDGTHLDEFVHDVVDMRAKWSAVRELAHGLIDIAEAPV